MCSVGVLYIVWKFCIYLLDFLKFLLVLVMNRVVSSANAKALVSVRPYTTPVMFLFFVILMRSTSTMIMNR